MTQINRNVLNFGLRTVRVCCFRIIFCVAFCCIIVSAQEGASQQPDVVRVNTELIQSPVVVLDQQHHFVEGLNREQFELTIDGHPRAILFFDRLSAGTANEAQRYAVTKPNEAPTASAPDNRSRTGRTVLFFVDDTHLSQESIYRTRMSLLHYIDHSMGQNDRVLITSVSGQIGFLQQLTDNKEVLRAAVDRINYRELFLTDDLRPAMSPYQALKVVTGESQVLNYFADMALMDRFSKAGGSQSGSSSMKDARAEMQRRMAEASVKNRAAVILQQYASITASTFAGLQDFVHSLRQLAGSKTVFLISDGFLLNSEISGELQKLNEITSSALRSGVIVYSVQASGLSNSYIDEVQAKKQVRLGPRMNTGAAPVGQDSAMQAPLYTIAVDSGGRAFFNSNSMDKSIQQALQERSEYYLLAWRPETDERNSGRFRQIQLKIKGHPEWSVRVQKGYFSATNAAIQKGQAEQTNDSPADNPQISSARVREALSARYPVTNTPVSLSLAFLDVPQDGPQITVSAEISVGQFLREQTHDGQIFLAGILLNDNGTTVSSFGREIRFNDVSTSSPMDETVSHAEVLKAKPGIYQVRLVAHNRSASVILSASDWIVIPNLTNGRLALSSLVVGDARNLQTSVSDQKARLSISHHFNRSSRLRFFTYIYNPSRSDVNATPDVTMQMRLLRDDQVISTSPPMKISVAGVADLSRIPYAAELSLQSLQPGHYALSVTATDNTKTKASATQTLNFVLE